MQLVASIKLTPTFEEAHPRKFRKHGITSKTLAMHRSLTRDAAPGIVAGATAACG
jgi:hypothetical protein